MDNITYGHNGAEVKYHVEHDEYECLGCNTPVDGPEGHENWECIEASRARAEDMWG